MATTDSDDKRFGTSKLLLEPRRASLSDLVRFLFSPYNIWDFIETTDQVTIWESFLYRFFIVLDVLAQKFLLFMKVPMAVFGDAITWWLNLLSSNGGLCMLFLRILTGRLVLPVSTSATFLSPIGQTDRRVCLDRDLKPGDRMYCPSLAFMASKLAYENEAFVKSVVTTEWKMNFEPNFFNFWDARLNDSCTHAFLCRDPKTSMIVVSFRGTEPFSAENWVSDIDLSWYKIEGVGKLHRGFMYALGQQDNGWPTEPTDTKHLYAYYEIRKKLKDMLTNDDKASFIVTGHSLGGALAILFAGVLAIQEEESLLERMEGVYTFGQPRVGDIQFGTYMEDKLRKYSINYLRFVYCNDIVPRMPLDYKNLLFKHFGPCAWYNSFYRPKIMKQVPNKNYFSTIWVMPMYMNAYWEVTRAFFMPIVCGWDFREGWFQLSYRMFGFMVPGLSDHGPQDYDNSTRLGVVLSACSTKINQ